MNVLLSLLLAAAHAAAAPAKKAPAIPEEARRAFVKGNTAFADAKDPDGFVRAASRYEEAIKLAPRWPEPQFNLAKAREAAGDHAGALSALRSYLKLPLPEAEKRQATDWSYALEEKAESKGKEAAEAASLDRFVGTWACSVLGGDREYHRLAFTVTREGKSLKLGGMMFEENPPLEVAIRGGELVFRSRWLLREPSGLSVKAVGTYTGTLSADGRRMNFRSAWDPYTPEQQRYWNNWPHGPGNAFGTQDWLKE